MSIIEKALDKLGTTHKPVKAQSSGNLNEKQNTDESLLEDTGTFKDQHNDHKISRSVEIDLVSLGNMGYLTPNTDNKILFEQYRRIKLPILKNAFENNHDRNNNIVIVTSSVSGEGKSFTSLNLAMSIAYEYNYTVLFIDADIIKRMSSKIMGVASEQGLIEYLKGKEKQLENLILRTNIPKLNLIPCGSSTELVTELYSSKKMDSLMEELSTRYHDRLIIIDTPPVLEDSSAKVLSNLADQIVYIVEAEKTPKHIVDQGLQMLGSDNSIGIVLNKSNIRHNPSYYYV